MLIDKNVLKLVNVIKKLYEKFFKNKICDNLIWIMFCLLKINSQCKKSKENMWKNVNAHIVQIESHDSSVIIIESSVIYVKKQNLNKYIIKIPADCFDDHKNLMLQWWKKKNNLNDDDKCISCKEVAFLNITEYELRSLMF